MYLKEVQGLRVVAALVVAVYHIWFQQVSGGVDAFFVISGFFIYRTMFKSGTPDGKKVLTYFQRTLARVLPSASLIIVATCAMFYVVDIDSIWSDQIKSAIAAIFFVENWWLASESANYLAREEVPSPFQQMWALSVQMQMYFILPVVLLSVSKLSGGRPATVGRIIAALFVLTFIYALLETARNQPFAYFNTGARVWEFLAGILLACALPHLSLSRRMAQFMGVTALLILTFFAAVLPVGSLFPGIAALIPVLATCAIIIGAANGAAIGILNAPIMQTLGNISFTFYLWHWPILILYWQVTGTYRTGFLPGIGIILVSGFLAYLTYAFAERAFRHSKIATGRAMIALPASVALMVPAVAAVGLWSLAYFEARDGARADVIAFRLGQEVAADFVPATVIGKSDVPRVYDLGCVVRGGHEEVTECVFGNPEGDILAVLVGGSHSAQWQPALDAVAERVPDLKIVTMLKGNCPLSVSAEDLGLSDDCIRWGRKVIDRVQQMEPDVVVTLLTTTRLHDKIGGDFVPSGFREAWDRLKGFPILAIRDNPRGEQDILNCVDRLGPNLMACSLAKAATLTIDRDPAPDLPAYVNAIDLSDRFCEDEICPPVIDRVLVYRDASHITATFAHTFADDFLAAFVNMGIFDRP